MLQENFENEHDEDERDPHFKGEYVFLDEEAARAALKPLFLDRAANPSSMKARMSILASALAHYHGGNYLAYPCNNNRYTGMQRYNGCGYNLSLPDEVRKLAAKKLLADPIHRGADSAC